MSLKKFNRFEDLKGLIPPNEKTSSEKQTFNPSPIEKQNLTAHFSKKHRAGKIVTVLKDFQCNDLQIEELARLIKKSIGVGGSIKNREIIIQGNYRSKIIDILSKQGHTIKKVGG
ncbi:MAG: translation initiation factor [Flavobacteriaceae bacterium]|nr:translation initiation factor [Flavobacteriaceae bacterium]